MNHIITKAKTKRGNCYNRRSTKTANGFSKVLADRRISFIHSNWKTKNREEKYKDLLSLAVRGTTDTLTSFHFYIKPAIKHHPIDKEYTKSVRVLSDMGKRKLNRMKKSYKKVLTN